MTPRKLFSLIILLAAVALPACGGDDDSGGAPAQPTRAEVLIAFDQPVTNLAGLEFWLNNSQGATFDNATQPVVPINTALGSLVVGNFDSATNSTKIDLTNGGAAGFNTGTTPIIKVTYNIAAGAGNPTFNIATAATFTAISDVNATPTTPPVTANNLVVTVTYQ